ncbi:MAG: response regulator [Nitrospirae bacterium]|nr:response regulator [Nitrospirota bacterium]
MKILIVDDNPDDRTVLRYIVQSRGHEVVLAGDGQEALTMASAHRPDIVISDVLMPVMDGFQFLRRLKQDARFASTPFIFYSASYIADQDRQLAASLGADGYIIKPREPSELWNDVERIIAGSDKKKSVIGELAGEDAEYFKRYSQIVAAKLEEKVLELEKTLAARKLAEDRLREREAFISNILETVDEGFIVVDRNYKILSANKAFCRFAGLPEDKVLGQPCYKVSHHIDRPCFEAGEDCAVRRTFATEAPHTATHVHVNVEGVEQHVETRSYPIADASGNIVSAIETITDVTEKKRLESHLRHSQKLEALGTLAAGVAHDFNNILNVIVGYGGLMEMTMPKDSPVSPYVREILTASERAARLTQSLLVFSRKQHAEFKPLEINELVDGMRKMALRLIGEDIETIIILAPEMLTVLGDCGQLEQVLMNLVTNARDAMPDGGFLRIETGHLIMDDAFVHLHGFGKPGAYALVSISDTGTGMNAVTRDKVFEPFFTTKEPGKGTGLGMSIAYGIITQHNGYINCYSEPGKGTTFRIYLPLVKTAFPETEGLKSAPVRGGSETILIADDDEAVRKLTRELLEKHGYKVMEARDGVDAVKKFADNTDKIGFVLLDIIMPRKSGCDALEEMRAIKSDIKALFISGYADEVISRKMIVEGGVEMIQKPARPVELLTKIREVLDT